MHHLFEEGVENGAEGGRKESGKITGEDWVYFSMTLYIGVGCSQNERTD